MIDEKNWEKEAILDEAKLLQQINQESQALQDANIELEQKMQKNNSLVADLQKKIEEFKQTALGQRDDRIDVLSKAIFDVRQELLQKEAEQAETHKRLQAAQKQMHELNQLVSTLRKEEELRLKKTEVMDEQLLAKTKELLQAKDSLVDMDAQMREMITEKARLRTDLMEKEKRLMLLDERRKPLEEAVIGLTDRVKRLEKTLREKDADMRKLLLKLKEHEILVGKQDERILQAVAQEKGRYEQRIKDIVTEHTKETLRIGSELERVRQLVEDQRNRLEAKDRAERELINEMLQKFNVTFEEPAEATASVKAKKEL